MTAPSERPAARRRTERLERLRELARRLPAIGGEVGADIEAVWPHRLLDPRRPAGPEGVSGLNMATVYGLRTDGCGAVACLAGLTVLEYPREAARTRARVAAERNLPPTGIDVLDVAARILGLDPATRDALFCGAGSRWVEDLGAIPRQAVLAALDRVIAGRRGAAIWSDSPPADPRPEA